MWSQRGVVPPNLVRLQKRATFPLFRSLLLGLENKQWAQVQAPALSEANVFAVIVSKVWSGRTVVSIQNKASLVWRREVKQTKLRTRCVCGACVSVSKGPYWSEARRVHPLTVLRPALMLSRHHRPKRLFVFVFSQIRSTTKKKEPGFLIKTSRRPQKWPSCFSGL